MKIGNATFAVSLVLIVALVVLNHASSGADSTQQVESARRKFKIPKLFDFDRFKSLFGKSYKSISEELARKRLFLGRAFRVFVSAINYKLRRSSSYLAINQMSDWTPDEVRTTHLQPKFIQNLIVDREDMIEDDSDDAKATTAPQANAVTTVSSIEDVEEQLSKLIDRSPPKFEAIAEELNEEESPEIDPSTQRSSKRRLSLTKLMRKPKLTSEPGDQVASNNLDYKTYERPEVTSTEQETEALKQKSHHSSKILTGALKRVTSCFGSNNQDNDDLPDEIFIDHRESGCFMEPRSQKKCGSCYAFSTVALYEWYYCRVTGKHVPFSEQYIIDCGMRASKDLNGCGGGISIDVSKFVNKYGLELRSNYPYRAINDECPYPEDTPAKAMGYLRVRDEGMEVLSRRRLSHHLKKAPIIVGLKTIPEFQEYGGGVDSPVGCDKNLLHSVLLVGSGREDGQEYWLFRNSYSGSWGEEGYYKMNKKQTKCVEYCAKIKKFKVPNHEESAQVSSEVKNRYAEFIESDLNGPEE